MSNPLNITTAAFGGLREVTTSPLWQYDYGQILRITGLDLPQAFEVHFSNSRKSGETVTQIGTDGQVTIPDMYLTSGADIYAFVFLHDGLTDGETEYVIKIPVRERPEPSDIEPTPEQQDAITEAIAALNAAVAQCDAQVEHYPTVINGYWYVWDEATEQFVSTGVSAYGNGIESAALNDDYTLTLYFTDGSHYTTPSIRGATGATGATPAFAIGTVTTLPEGSQATATITGTAEHPVLNLGIPVGETGVGIQSIYKTGTSGAVDTYTILYTDGETTTFTVTNGAVTSVAGKTGAVTLDGGDVAYDPSATYADGTIGKAVTATNDALLALDTKVDGKAPAIYLNDTGYENTIAGTLASAELLGPVEHTTSLFNVNDLIFPVAKKAYLRTANSGLSVFEYISPNTLHLSGTAVRDTWCSLSTTGTTYYITLDNPLPVDTKLSFRMYLSGTITGDLPYANIIANSITVSNACAFDSQTKIASRDWVATEIVTDVRIMLKVPVNTVLNDVYISFALYADGQEVLIPAFNDERKEIDIYSVTGWNKICSIPVQNHVQIIADTKTYIDDHAPEDYVKQSEIVDFLKRQELVYVMPEFFGGKGDFSTDDTVAIQDCIDYAISHGKLPVKMFGRYKISDTINIVSNSLNVYINVIDNSTTTDAAIVLTGKRNRVEIGSLSSDGDSFVVQSTDEMESSGNIVTIDFCYSRQARCIVLADTALNTMYYNEFHLKFLSAATNCIYSGVAGGEHRFIGNACPLRSGSWAIVAGHPANIYSGFMMEDSANKGIYCPLRYNGGHFENIRTVEMMDCFGKYPDDPERGLLAKGAGVGYLSFENTYIDYVAIDTSECPSFSTLQEDRQTADVRANPMYKNLLYRHCDAESYTADGMYVGVQCFVPRETYMLVWFDKKYVIPTEDFIYTVSQNLTIPNWGIFRQQQMIIPTVFDIADDCEITLSESYNPIAIKRITVVQNTTGKTATVYAHNGTMIFDGADHGNGVYILDCVITPDPYTEGASSYTFEHLYLGFNEQWIMHV